MGNGEGPPIALVTVDSTNGQVKNKTYFEGLYPESIFFL